MLCRTEVRLQESDEMKTKTITIDCVEVRLLQEVKPSFDIFSLVESTYYILRCSNKSQTKQVFGDTGTTEILSFGFVAIDRPLDDLLTWCWPREAVAYH